MLKTRLKLFIIIAFLLFFSARCDSGLHKEAQESSEKMAEEQKKQALERSGYKDAKWGMSPEEVKKALRMNMITESKSSDGDYYIVFDKVDCWFYKNQFYQAEYKPNLHDDDTEGFRAVVDALEEKYGGGKALENKIDAVSGIPLLIFLWEDKVTKIKLRMLDPESFAKYGGRVFPSSTLKVIYESKELRAKKEDEESQKEHNKMEKRKESIKDDL